MLQFIWFYAWHLTLVPLGILITKPFNKWTWYMYAEHILFNIFKIRHTTTADEPLIETGYVLANHRSWLDFGIDPFLAKSCILSRRAAIFTMFFAFCLGFIDDILIVFVRGKEKRIELFLRIKQHIQQHKTNKRLLFWPEGTRLKYTHLASSEDVKTYLKYGLLKSIYEDKELPVQLQISNNKENVWDEKRIHIRYGVSVHTHRSKSIHPKDFTTEHEFYDEIARVWYDCWIKTHMTKEE